MPSLPNLKKYAKIFLENSHLAIRDLSDAFRQIPLYYADSAFVCYSLFGLVWRDCTLPYGISSSPANCQYFVQLLIWILNHKVFDENQRNNTLCHIDDFILCGKSEDCVIDMGLKFDNLMNKLGIEISHKIDSYVKCCFKAVVYGVEWNLKTKRCSIPWKKLFKFKRFLILAMRYRAVTGRYLDSIAGNIFHFSQLNPLAKCLTWKLMKYIQKNLRSDDYNPSNIYFLPLDIIREFKFWFIYIDLVKDIPIENILTNNSKMNIYGATDASDDFGGWIIGNHWSYFEFDNKNWHINCKELYALLCAVYTLKSELTGKRIHIYIDNKTAELAMANKWSGSMSIMLFVYELCHLMIEYKIFVYVDWISSATNVLADALSRKQWDIFWNSINLFNLQVNKFPTKTIKYNDFKFINSNENDSVFMLEEYKDFINWLHLPESLRKLNPYPNYGDNFNVDNV